MMYLLKIRVGREYYPVKWPSGQICWDESLPVRPTTFDVNGRLKAEQELQVGGYKEGDYMFIETEEEPSQSLTQNETGAGPTIRRLF